MRRFSSSLFLLSLSMAFALGEPPAPQNNQGWANAQPPPPPAQQGWGQQQQAQPQAQGWGQQAPQPAQNQGWGQQAQTPQAQGWGQQQQSQGWGQQPQQQQSQGWGQQQQQSQGWGQSSQSGGGGGNKGSKGLDWEYNFALGYQGDKGGNKGGSGWGKSNMESSGGGWSSEPETNIKKPNIGEIFSSIISFPRELFKLFKESGLWILFVPLLVIIPLFLLAFKAGNFFGGMKEGWGWDKRSGSVSWLEAEWESVKKFVRDERVQRAAKGFLDELGIEKILQSVENSGTKKVESLGEKKTKQKVQ